MGAIFSAPKPPAPPPPPAPAVDPEVEARQRRLEEIDRHRRGRAGTIATSSRGLLQASDGAASGKTLFGE